MDESNVLVAFGLTLFAGLATGIGSALAFFAKQTNARFLSISLGFSAGVMIYVSLVEIFVKARDELEAALGATEGYWATTGAFFGGILLCFIGLVVTLPLSMLVYLLFAFHLYGQLAREYPFSGTGASAIVAVGSDSEVVEVDEIVEADAASGAEDEDSEDDLPGA